LPTFVRQWWCKITWAPKKPAPCTSGGKPNGRPTSIRWATAWLETAGQYQTSFAAWSPAQQALKKTELEQKEVELEKYGAAIREQAQAEEDKLLGGALAQINSFVKAYAREQGYTVVLGTTQSGSLLYASDAVDITDQVLRGLNESYKK
jgi:Skp family chaperone for outer membrane proteins